MVYRMPRPWIRARGLLFSLRGSESFSGPLPAYLVSSGLYLAIPPVGVCLGNFHWWYLAINSATILSLLPAPWPFGLSAPSAFPTFRIAPYWLVCQVLKIYRDPHSWIPTLFAAITNYFFLFSIVSAGGGCLQQQGSLMKALLILRIIGAC